MKKTRPQCCFGFFAIAAATVIMAPRCATGDSFDWRSVAGQNWITPVKSQWWGTCWAHGNIACLEAKYKITRNDYTYNPDLSEENIVWDRNGTSGDMGCTAGGGPYVNSFTYFWEHGVVSEAELPLGPWN
ncbi:MAG: hypothetical protein JXB10_15275, partial [Pirellulales bacterium]|nr:hypothetical protein [Pirellulales bacterium]